MMSMGKWITLAALGWLFAFPTMAQAKGPKTPPGTRYEKTLGHYVDTDVLTMMDWQEFVHYTLQRQGEHAAAGCQPDTAVIKAHYGRNVYASRAAGDRKLPVVGVTPEQIADYCAFRTEAVRQVKGFVGSGVVYQPLDAASAKGLTRSKGIRGVAPVGTKLPEAIIDGEDRMIVQGGHAPDGVFGFRCLAMFE